MRLYSKLLQYLLMKNIKIAIAVFTMITPLAMMFSRLDALYLFCLVLPTIYLFQPYWNKKSVNFYCCLPIKKIHFLNIRLLVNWITIFIPTLLGICVSTLFLGMVEGTGFQLNWNQIQLAILFGTYVYFLTVLFTTLSNTYLDALLLTCIFPLVLILFVNGVAMLFFYIRGFAIQFSFFTNLNQYLIVTPVFLFENKIPLHYLVYCFGLYIVMYLFICFFVHTNASEDIGIKMSRKHVYSIIKMISTFAFLLYIPLFSIEHRYQTFNNVHDVLEVFIYNNLHLLVIGLMLYLIGCVIQKKRVENVLKSVLQYVMIVAVFIIFLTSFMILKAPLYENKSIKDITSVYIENENLPMLYELPLRIPVVFKDERSIQVVRDYHSVLKDKTENYSLGEMMKFVFNQGMSSQMIRAYPISKSGLEKLYINKYFNKDSAFYKKVENLFMYDVQMLKNNTWITLDEKTKFDHKKNILEQLNKIGDMEPYIHLKTKRYRTNQYYLIMPEFE